MWCATDWPHVCILMCSTKKAKSICLVLCSRIWRCFSQNLRTLISTRALSTWYGKRKCSMEIGLTGLWVMAADRKSWVCLYLRPCRRMGHGTSTYSWWREVCPSTQRRRATRRQPLRTSQSVRVYVDALYERVCKMCVEIQIYTS